MIIRLVFVIKELDYVVLDLHSTLSFVNGDWVLDLQNFMFLLAEMPSTPHKLTCGFLVNMFFLVLVTVDGDRDDAIPF
ncbi:hypothetical protein L6452_31910 [Arctium lappa]|uniref:Uncharacterized protein n=1 Tax=Arctium lappa TaxID=4217 RepID=A0ACB8Z3Q8_ARCLA|nr:hypothetical protein L6452_31910 [Arctium lappa]